MLYIPLLVYAFAKFIRVYLQNDILEMLGLPAQDGVFVCINFLIGSSYLQSSTIFKMHHIQKLSSSSIFSSL